MTSRAELVLLLEEGIRHHHMGELHEAERIYRQVLAADADAADAWHMLATALQAQGVLEEAARAAERATTLRSKIAAYWLTRGHLEAARGVAGEAQKSFRRAIALEAGFPEAYYALARILHSEERLPEAIAAYRQALRGAPQVAEIHFHLARALLACDRPQDAFDEYRDAFALDRKGELDRSECFERFISLKFESLPDFWYQEMLRFLERPDVDKSRYMLAALNVLRSRPAFEPLQSAGRQLADFPAGALDEIMRDPLLGILLRDTQVGHPQFEALLGRVRTRLLLDSEANERAPLDFLCDMALQSFNSQFVLSETPAELARLPALQAEVEVLLGLGPAPASDRRRMRPVATLAMYRPLTGIAGIDALLGADIPEVPFARLIKRSVADAREEKRLRTDVRVVGAPTDAVSEKVRAQYEEHPYPRWFSLQRAPAVSAAAWISAQLLGTMALPPIPDAPRVLVAGCGTGREAIGLASGITGARVLAVDLSLSSLAYAKRQAKALGVENIEFAHGDILQFDALGERFDIVHSVGVLHHMRDPEAGLGMLLRVAQPGGLMKLGLYSSRARAEALGPARELIRQQNWSPSESSIRAFRRLVLESPPDSPLRGLLRIRDFFSISECRDLLFHVQEHEFELPQLAQMLSARGITVLGLAKPLARSAMLAYRKMVPQDRGMADLQRWDAVERLHPETFLAMYQVWCRVPAASVDD